MKRILSLFLLLAMIAGIFAGCAAKDNKNFRSEEDFAQAKIGVLTGSVFLSLAGERYPEAKLFQMNLPNLVLNLKQGKIDGVLMDKGYYAPLIWNKEALSCIGMDLPATEYAVAFPKTAQSELLISQVNGFISTQTENGWIAQQVEKWFSGSEPDGSLDFSQLTGENGTLRVATTVECMPFAYLKNEQFCGYDADFIFRFAKEYGYDLKIDMITFDALLPGLASQRYDLVISGITVTEERRESMLFSEAYYKSPIIMAVLRDTVSTDAGETPAEFEMAEPDSTARTSFRDELKEDFHKTFIRENRWKMILQGIGVTMLISICSAIAGTLLGFGLYMLGRSEVKLLQALAGGIAKVYSRIVAGTPVVVILMILFYVIFGKIRDMSGIVVAIMGFTLTFGAFVYEHMTVSVRSVDRGQTEAAYALGYTRNQTFFRIIFPQAMTIFLPSYCGQAVELIKATAVVGYISVNDLTKVGDIIRSNTYEAFFPLIATAVIYFLLTWMLSALLGLMKRQFEPKHRSAETILKGVKIK